MKKILVVVDMQNDFIDGALGTAEAAGIVGNVIRKIHSYPPDCIYATRDTHGKDYLETPEGKYLPVEHCIKGTEGWEIRREVEAGRLQCGEDGRICMAMEAFDNLLLALRNKWKDAFSKEFREMEQEKLLRTVKSYLVSWMMAAEECDRFWILPAAGKTSGFYPKDYKGAKEKEHA